MTAGTLPGYHVITKPIGPICNLDCSYCFYLKKEDLYSNNRRWRMSPEVLESYIRQYIESQQVPEISFTWQGGEPTLLGVDFFRQVVKLQSRYADGKSISNAFQTNGVLLNPEWGEFLAEHSFLVGLSIDGPEDLHDKYRVDKGGKPSFLKVMKGLEVLRGHQVEFNTLTVVNRANSEQPERVYEFLKSIGSQVHQYIPLVERDERTKEIAERSVRPEDFGRFLIGVFDRWVQQDVGRTFVQLFEISLQSWLGLPAGLCFFRETCGASLAVEHNGDVYSCDHYVDGPNLLGNLMENPMESLVNSAQQRLFGQDKRDTLPGYCRDCDVRFACHGECPKNRFMTTPEGEAGLNYLCAGYKAYFHHVAPYMKFMATCLRRGMSPLPVMEMARVQMVDDRSLTQQGLGS